MCICCVCLQVYVFRAQSSPISVKAGSDLTAYLLTGFSSGQLASSVKITGKHHARLWRNSSRH